jgi:isopenicillin N synthase-like dioxygenase
LPDYSNTAASELTKNQADEPRREAVQSLPVIDISPFLPGGDAARKSSIARDLRKACIDVGFLYLVGHGLPSDELKQAESLARSFFELPLDVKMRYRATQVGGTGFVRVGGLNPETAGGAADIKERFTAVRKTNVSKNDGPGWPDDAIVPGFTAFMQNHIRNRVAVANAMVHAFALSLEFPEDYFDAAYKAMAYNMALNYYPPLTEADVKKSQWSFSPHTDYGGFTLLSQDSIGGLQVQNSAGQWIPVPPKDNHFVVNLGDLTQLWTNGLYKSTLHRANNVSGVARISIPFFASPSRDTIIEALPTCVSASNPARHKPVTTGEYLDGMVEKTDTTGKPGISELTATRLKVS